MFLFLLSVVSALLPVVSAFDFGNLRNVRSILGVHAFASTVYKQVQDEIFQHQFDVLVLSDNLQLEPLMRDVSLSLIGILVAVMGYNMYFSPNSSLYKLQELIEYNNMRRPLRVLGFVFVVVFLRDIQNAI